MKKQIPHPLRVGFDLDGVILYNPARIIRPLVSLVKRFFLKKKSLTFYYPKSPLEKTLWRLLHKSSIFIAPGINDVRLLVKEGKIEAYIITARFSYLGPELQKWIQKKKLHEIFTQVYFNEKNEQPHLFKERMIKKLNLDAYVEDNFDIVSYLLKRIPGKIFWIYNLFDRHIYYERKYPSLKKVVDEIRKIT